MEIFREKVSFIKYIKGFARTGFITGCILTLFLLINALLGAGVSFGIGDNAYTGPVGALMMVVFVPLFIMSIMVLIGIVSYIVSLFISWCLSFIK